MKTILALATVAGLASAALADIQDPPGNDYGPTRKLGRGLSNFIIAPTDFFVTVNQVNQTEGNSAGAGYGVWRGLGRAGARHVAGLIEILTFPFPIWHHTYYPILPPDIPYIHAGYPEFPPEVGNESKYPYVRDSHQDFN
ncbi:MAG: exosortase system-associated protein, TIGR04073 family [Verrucomicrobia bacterium]|nr:MAG: exosortase system-associated protein, TIGR04073 family [Verrucomicrobiota bacterium]